MGVKQNETPKARASILLTGAWVDAGRLSQQHRRELFFSLPKRLQDDRATAFLQDVSDGLVHCENDLAPEKPSLVRDAGAQVSDAVDELRTALSVIRSNETLLIGFEGQFLRHLHRVDPDRVNADASADVFLNKLVSDLDTLRDVAKGWSENADTDSHNQPSTAHKYNIACCTARAWRTHFYKEPTANTTERKTPFLNFLAALGARARVNTTKPDLYPAGFGVGASIANQAIRETKNSSMALVTPEANDKKR